MRILNKLSSAMETHIRPATLPIAIKMLESEEEIPDNMKRPRKDLGVQLIPCQATYLSRKHEIPLAMLREDFNIDLCAPGSIIFGIVQPIDWWKEGNVSYGIYTRTRKAAVTMERNVFRFKYRRYVGFLTSPLKKAMFEPDMVMLYCNSEQAMVLAAASRYDDGLPITTTISARDVCSDSIVQTIKTGKCQVCIPCRGDRSNAYAGADEIVFTAPPKKLQTIIEALKDTSKARSPAIMRVLGKKESTSERKYKELARRIKNLNNK